MAESTRNLERTGALVLASVAVAFAAATLLPRLPWSATQTHSFVVPMDRGIQTLVPGSTVLAAGLPAGEVVSIEPVVTSPQVGEADAMKVVFRLPASIAIFEGAQVRLVTSLIGSGTNVALVNAFRPGRSRVPDGSELPWIAPPSTLETIFGTRNWHSIEDSRERFERLFENVPAYRTQFVDEGTAIRDRVVTLGDEAQADFARWTPDRERIVEGFELARTRASDLMSAFERMQDSWAAMRRAFDGVDAKIKAFFPAGGGNLDQLGAFGDLPSLGQLGDRFRSVVAAADAVKPAWSGLVGLVRGPWDWAVEDVRLSIADMTLAVGQFSRLGSDLERAPLRALLEALGVIAGTIPSEATVRKMESDEALRRFVMATADLRAAHAAIEAWVRQAPPEGLADPVPPSLRAWFDRAQADFAAAAEALFRRRISER